jgi:hypothetical protein
MKKIILVMVVMMMMGSVFGQIPSWAWAKAPIGEGEGYAVATDAANNVYITGYYFGPSINFGSATLPTITAGSAAVYITKYNMSGNVIWARSGTGASSQSFGTSITTDVLGNIYVTGYYYTSITFGAFTLTSSGSSDIFLVKYDTNGNVLWAKSEGGTAGEYATGVVTDNSGNVLISGIFQSPTITFGTTTFTTLSLDAFLIKYDSSGTLQWAKSSISNNAYVSGVATDGAGKEYITGYFASTTIQFGTFTLTRTETSDAFLVKYDESGNVLWAKTSTGASTGYAIPNAVTATPSGKVAITGYYVDSPVTFGTSTLTPSTSAQHGFLVQYSSSGIVEWASNISATLQNAVGYSVASDALNNIYVSGAMDTLTLTLDTVSIPAALPHKADPMFIAKYNSTGHALWAKSLASGGDDQSGITVDNAGDIYITGDYLVNPFIIGNDTLGPPSSETPFVAKLSQPSHESVTEINNTNEINIFPNPTSSTFTITSTEKIESVKLYNVLGEVIWQNNYHNVNTAAIDLPGNISSPSGRSGGVGLYFVEIKTEKGIVRKKIIKE